MEDTLHRPKQSDKQGVNHLELDLEDMVKQGWLYVDGFTEETNDPIYKCTEVGMAVLRWKMKAHDDEQIL